ncbi:hypothetical protein SynNOUM97013_01823 [Synechococcus sp. NOUM97013]|nr:hypothetical protein SynNOUM97013_01823 [Synechococcus sp. NOUM97013]
MLCSRPQIDKNSEWSAMEDEMLSLSIVQLLLMNRPPGFSVGSESWGLLPARLAGHG